MAALEPEEVRENLRPLGTSLSTRERQLLLHAAQGLTDQGIAHRLGISLATVGTYWGRVRIKFGPLSRTELVAVYLREESTATITELKEANSTLLEAIEEHNRTEDELRSALDMFRGLLGSVPDPIVVVNEKGVIEMANQLAEELFGYAEGELAGLSVESLIPERYHEQHLVNRQEYLENPVRKKMGEHLATFAKRKDGTEFPIAAALSSTRNAGGTLTTCLVRELTEPA